MAGTQASWKKSNSSGKKRKKPKNPHKMYTSLWWNWKLENATTGLQLSKVQEQFDAWQARTGGGNEKEIYTNLKKKMAKL